MPQLQSVSLRNFPEDDNRYPFNLPLIKNFEGINFESNITFFVGENGAGKSTILEGIAANLNLPTAGSVAIDIDPMLEPARRLGNMLWLRQTTKSNRGFFTRAEDFIGFVNSKTNSGAKCRNK